MGKDYLSCGLCVMGRDIRHECIEGGAMIVQLQTARGKVNVSIRDEFDDCAIKNAVVRELKESKRLKMFEPIKVTGFRYGKDR